MLLPIFENCFKKDVKRLQKREKDMTTLKNVIDIAISIVVRYKVLGFEESGVRILL